VLDTGPVSTAEALSIGSNVTAGNVISVGMAVLVAVIDVGLTTVLSVLARAADAIAKALLLGGPPLGGWAGPRLLSISICLRR
jgi:hypothetical protein